MYIYCSCQVTAIVMTTIKILNTLEHNNVVPIGKHVGWYIDSL